MEVTQSIQAAPKKKRSPYPRSRCFYAVDYHPTSLTMEKIAKLSKHFQYVAYGRINSGEAMKIVMFDQNKKSITTPIIIMEQPVYKVDMEEVVQFTRRAGVIDPVEIGNIQRLKKRKRECCACGNIRCDSWHEGECIHCDCQ